MGIYWYFFIFRNTVGFCNHASFWYGSRIIGKRNSALDAEFLLECCPHASPGFVENWSQRPAQFTAAQWGYSRMSCCCHGGSLLHVPLSSHFRDMPPLPCKPSGSAYCRERSGSPFPQACLQLQPEFLPVAAVTSPQLLELSHNMPPSGLGKHQMLAGSQGEFSKQENLSNAVLRLPLEWVGKVKPSTSFSRSHWCPFPVTLGLGHHGTERRPGTGKVAFLSHASGRWIKMILGFSFSFFPVTENCN